MSAKNSSNMLVTTSHILEGKKVNEYLGIVSGEAVMGANVFKDITASIRDIIGGRSGQYEEQFRKAREISIDEMVNEAEQKGANAVIGVDIDYESIGGTMMLVTASGTAVKVE